jgi:hypothetical protein
MTKESTIRGPFYDIFFSHTIQHEKIRYLMNNESGGFGRS